MDRKWGTDGPNMKKYFDEMKKYHYPTTLLLFPEGTTIDIHTRKRSQEYAKECNRKVFQVFIIYLECSFTSFYWFCCYM